MMCITNLPLFMHTKIARQLTLARALRLELANLLLLERQKKNATHLPVINGEAMLHIDAPVRFVLSPPHRHSLFVQSCCTNRKGTLQKITQQVLSDYSQQ